MNNSTAFFILSAARDGDGPIQQRYRTKLLESQLRALGYATARCTGMYKGKRESSILVIDETPSSYNCQSDVMRLADRYGQESVLEVDTGRAAALIYPGSCRRTKLGQFVRVRRDMALASDGYTKRAGQYYVCR